MLTLWQQMLTKADQASASGHLLTIESKLERISAENAQFAVRYSPDLMSKIRAAHTGASQPNPFSPPEPELTVCPIGSQHTLILNKFNVLSVHGLLVTNRFVEQTHDLSLADFYAINELLTAADGLVFYNGGKTAGASQPHRHFQLIDRDLGVGRDAFIEPLINNGVSVAFQYRAIRLAHFDAESLFDTWRKLEYAWQPYNLLITRDYMVVVPRSQESVAGISLNAMAYAGAFLAKTETELVYIKQHGPIALLNAAGVVG